ncbi:MAG TPA: carbohydrate-binding protein, partial [Trebonia sp.]|nr:carbohydrate-binding protein [Trebonia sp.]
AVPQTQQSSGLLCATANIGAATLAQWNVVAGTPPAGTASSTCPVTETGATSVSATAGQAGSGLQFQGIGQTNAGSDGNLTQITQGGQPAVETWTSSQSGAGDANVYLQLNPMSAVEAAATVTVKVTYWATAGQGFTVQYDTPANAYQNGPTVTSPGTGTWTTATVQLTGAQFQEAENGGADLRLNVTNASTPLIVQNVTMSTSGGTSEGPYGGTAAAIPGTVQAANYDTGGQGVAYNVTSVNGSANSYRSDGVDLEACSDSGCGDDLGWTTAGQWFKYTVNVATAGTYTVSVRVASPSGVTDGLHIANSAGTNLSGNINVPATGGWQTWQTVTATVTLPAGVQTLTLDQDNGGWNLHSTAFALAEGPYGGTPAAIPGTLQAANYDTGGQGVAYNVTSVNGTGNSYRSGGVDLESCSDTGCGYDLGWTAAGQWCKYTVNVAAAGTYTVSFRLASPNGVTGALHIANSAGANLSGAVSVPATGGWQDWATVTASVTLPAGVQTLTVDQDNGGWNLHSMAFATGSA